MKENSEILAKVLDLRQKWKLGKLGGEKMPEDSSPGLDRSGEENLIYFTLPMALNYQRNSYKLWESALATYIDSETRFVFNANIVANSGVTQVREALVKYKLALQPNKQTEIWIRLCKTICKYSSLLHLYEELDFDIEKILKFMQCEHKSEFPYLSGNKICNYYLFVLTCYTDFEFKNKNALSIAPDTHICQASLELGLISSEEYQSNSVQKIVVKRWENLLSGTKFYPIDFHTPLWLWSRNGFQTPD